MNFSNAIHKDLTTNGVEESIFTTIQFIDNPVANKITVERSQEIEALLMPKLMAAFDELKKTSPLFSKKSKK